MEAPFLETLKARLDEALSNRSRGRRPCLQQSLELDNLKDPSNPNYSVSMIFGAALVL